MKVFWRRPHQCNHVVHQMESLMIVMMTKMLTEMINAFLSIAAFIYLVLCVGHSHLPACIYIGLLLFFLLGRDWL